MSSIRRRGLQLDDPLAPGPPSQPEDPAAPAATASGSSQKAAQPDHRTAQARQVPEVEPPGKTSPAPRSAKVQATRCVADEPTGDANTGVWRRWSGIAGVGSFRLPHELLVELGDTGRELGLPIGMMVTAAITQLLDQPPDTIAALVDRADDARIQGRRAARRGLADRAGG